MDRLYALFFPVISLKTNSKIIYYLSVHFWSSSKLQFRRFQCVLIRQNYQVTSLQDEASIAIKIYIVISVQCLKLHLKITISVS